MERRKVVKALLSSESISGPQADALAGLVGKAKPDISLALFENAADVDPSQPEWMLKARETIEGHGFHVERLDLRDYKDEPTELMSRLELNDVILFGGGNTFYLRWLMQQTGADKVIKDLVHGGKVYGGISAGAVVAGPTLKYIDAADRPKEALDFVGDEFDVIWDGLELIDKVVIPHMDQEEYGIIMRGICGRLIADGVKVEPLNDNEALVIDGVNQRKI